MSEYILAMTLRSAFCIIWAMIEARVRTAEDEGLSKVVMSPVCAESEYLFLSYLLYCLGLNKAPVIETVNLVSFNFAETVEATAIRKNLGIPSYLVISPANFGVLAVALDDQKIRNNLAQFWKTSLSGLYDTQPNKFALRRWRQSADTLIGGDNPNTMMDYVNLIKSAVGGARLRQELYQLAPKSVIDEVISGWSRQSLLLILRELDLI